MKIANTIALFSFVFATAFVRADEASSRPAVAASEQLAPAPIELLEHVQKQLRTVETMESSFVQQKRLTVLKHILTIKGHLALQKPAYWAKIG